MTKMTSQSKTLLFPMSSKYFTAAFFGEVNRELELVRPSVDLEISSSVESSGDI